VQGWVKMEENHFSVSYSNGYPDGSASGLFIDSCTVQNPLFICNIVLIEWYWVLTTSYNVPKDKIIEEIEYFFRAGDVLLQNQELCHKALSVHQEGSADFADCLIGILNQEENCKTTYTFHKKTSRLSAYTLLD